MSAIRALHPRGGCGASLGARFLRSALVSLALALSGACNSAGAADILRGRDIYGTHCAQCHGRGGVSVLPGAPSFARGENLMKPDVMLLAQIRTGRNVMPAFQGILSDRDILNVIAFLRTLQ